MADPTFKSATSDDAETLIVMMRDLYAHDGLGPFDEGSGRRALLGVIGDDTFGRVFLILLANEVAGYAVLTLCKLCLNRPPEHAPPLKFSSDAAKGSNA